MSITQTTYTIIDLEQGSQEWLDWRKGIDLPDGPRITATAACTIAGTNPYRTIEELFGEFIGTTPPQASNWAMQRGQRLEPLANALYTQETGEYAAPTCVQNDDHPWISASLDGISMDGATGLEIKCPGQKTIDLAIRGEVPPNYYDQIQWQHLSTGNRLSYIDYCVFGEQDDGTLYMVTPIQVKPDATRQEELVKLCAEFRRKVHAKASLHGDDLDEAALQYAIIAHRIAALKDETAYMEDQAAPYADILKKAVEAGSRKTTTFKGATVKVTNFKEKEKVDAEGYLSKVLELVEANGLKDLLEQINDMRDEFVTHVPAKQTFSVGLSKDYLRWLPDDID